MTSTPRTTRTCLITIRTTPGERAIVRAKAHAAGLPVSTYMRQAGLGLKVQARRGQARRDAIYHLSKIGTNLNQIARVVNTTGQLVALELLEPAIEELRAVLERFKG